jgi:putative membrane protein
MPFLGHFWTLFIVLLFWVAVIALIIWLIRRVSPAGGPSANALNILSERFARGEIDQQEYEKRKDALKDP